MANKSKTASELLSRRFGNDTKRQAEIDQFKDDMAIGSLIYEARKASGLTQSQLAGRIGTTQSVISELESADYQGHSMPMLRRIAKALGLSIEMKFVSKNTLEHA